MGNVVNVLSVDVEDYFHPTEVAAPEREWTRLPHRVDAQTTRILDLFERHGVRATFFVLGWVAEKNPALVRRIADRGHEIGCHSHLHRLVYSLSIEEFRTDTLRAIRAIEDACGVRPTAYRAPSFSITGQSLWALQVLAELGFEHDSSIYPVEHDRYGFSGYGRHACTIDAGGSDIIEVPPATARVWSRNLPVGGGGYLRIFPYRYVAAGIREINQADGRSACVYFHPWEIDVEQPRMISSRIGRLRTYTGLGGMYRKIERLLEDFRFAPMREVHSAANGLAKAVCA
jgi:polysaccharide deacetylase family protein (PEP-CTERM system associated)